MPYKDPEAKKASDRAYRLAHFTPKPREQWEKCGRKPTHGMTGHPGYNAWRCMIDRCYNPPICRYERYGGRGITVCDRWRESFANFWADMGALWRPGLTLDRQNNDGNYEQSNCRWATYKQQANNRCDTRKVG